MCEFRPVVELWWFFGRGEGSQEDPEFRPPKFLLIYIVAGTVPASHKAKFVGTQHDVFLVRA